jgi:hypothetical protein
MAILAGRAPQGTLERGPVVWSCFADGLDAVACDSRRRAAPPRRTVASGFKQLRGERL